MENTTSLRTKILAENPETFIAGCNCHLAHLVARKGSEAYASITKFDFEDYQVHLYYLFKSSTPRQCILQKYMDFVGSNEESLRDSFQLGGYPERSVVIKNKKSTRL